MSPRRGEVWADRDGYEYLVVSIDSFNQSRMNDVVVVGVYEGDLTENGTSPYATEVDVEGTMRTIVYDDVMLISKDDLVDAVWVVGDEILKDLGQHLAAVLTPTAGAAPGRRPRAYPQTGEIRFADLHIEGEDDKPVVVVSSEEYGERVGYVFVIACRVSSDSTKIRTFDVKLRSQNGKVVCSHIQSVHRQDITYRTTTGAKFVTAGEAREIVEKVHHLLGLD